MQNPGALSEDKEKASSGIIRSGNSFQNTSQFRTIAPKMVPKVITSEVVSCLLPAFPEQTNPISATSSKPLIMPIQNYTLMQVAGHEGTFSLVALPHITTPAMAAQRIQQSNMPVPKNLKLPIPRYQSVKNKLLIDKTIQTSSSSAYNKIPMIAQISSKIPATGDLPETHSATDSSEQVILIDRGSTKITVATLPRENNCVTSGSPLLNKTQTAEDSILGPSVIKEPLSKPMNASNPVKINLLKSTIETTKGSVIMSEKLKEKMVNSASSVTVLSPAILSNVAQLTQSSPKGKLPILPYSRMKNAMFCNSKQNSNSVAASTSGQRSECENIPSLVKTFNVSTRVYDKLLAISFAEVSKEATCENTFSPADKLDVGNLKKLSGIACNRRGRKLRTPDDILAFHTKRRKCIINKFREGKERVKIVLQEPKDRKTESVKKYRSIRPKPVDVMQPLAPLISPAAIIETQIPDCIEQDIFLNDSLPNKYLCYKQNDGSFAKPNDPCRNVFPTIPKPWHKCHVCNHNFQFKHHLQDHMNTHTNRRPYTCRICHKAYVHSGSLSTHMTLHHKEGRLKKRVCCEFCAKVFGHAKVYFGHLKEIHGVVISTEPSTSKQQLQDALKNRNINIKESEETIKRRNICSFEDLLQSQAEVKLQIKCGRCQLAAQSFAEMKLHLLCFHGEEIQGRIKKGILQGGKVAQEEPIRHAAHFWKKHKKRQKPAKHVICEEEYYAFPKLKKQIYLNQNNFDVLTESEVIQSGNNEPGRELQNIGCAIQNKKIQIWGKPGHNCILCKQIFRRKEELFSHWQNHHNCEDPSILWTIFNSFSKQGVI